MLERCGRNEEGAIQPDNFGNFLAFWGWYTYNLAATMEYLPTLKKCTISKLHDKRLYRNLKNCERFQWPIVKSCHGCLKENFCDNRDFTI